MNLPGRKTGVLAERTPRLKRAMVRARSRWAVAEAALLALAIALMVLWLALPDAQLWQFALSLLLGLVLAAGLLWLQSLIFGVVRRRKVRAEAWPGALLLAGLLLVWWAVAAFFDAGAAQDGARATLWHEKASGGLRELCSEDRLRTLQGVLWSALRWAAAAAVLPMGIEGAATGLRGRWARRAGAVLREPLYWICVVVGGVAAEIVTVALLNWSVPGSAVVTFSVAVLKVGLGFALDAALVCFTLSLAGTYLRDAERTEGGGEVETFAAPRGAGRPVRRSHRLRGQRPVRRS